MILRELGRSGIQTSVLGFGAWAIGGWLWGGAEESDSIRAIHAALHHGINLVDTAPMYGYGRSEEVVGKAIKGRRDQVVLATKCGLRPSETDWPTGQGVLHFYGTDKGIAQDGKGIRVYKYLRAESIRWETEQSLKRLGTDHIDLMQTHWQDETTPIAETMGTLLELKNEGKIRAIGVSNVTKSQLAEYLAVGQVDVVQQRYSLLDREVERDGILELCKKNGVSLLAYSPMRNGLLTGKIDPDRKFGEGDLRNGDPKFTPDNIRKVNAALSELTPIARKYDLTPGQLIIAWTFAKYEKMHVLCGARNAAQVEENVVPGDVVLTEEEIATIEHLATKM